MLPVKVMQMDYQDFGWLVSDHLSLIEDFQSKNNIVFDVVVSKLRNGVIAGSIIANHLGIPLAVLSVPRQKDYNSFEVFFDSEVLSEMQKRKLNVLFVDSICGTGETLANVRTFFDRKYGESISLVSYITLIDVRSTVKPDIIGFQSEKFFQPPWEWRSFTSKSHLDRLEVNDIKASREDVYSVAFSSQETRNKFEQQIGQKIIGEWIAVFDSSGFIPSPSGVSSFVVPEEMSLVDASGKFSKLIDEKVDFIKKSGITHFIESDLYQALLISEKCPVANILYFNQDFLFRIYAKGVTKESFLKLNF